MMKNASSKPVLEVCVGDLAGLETAIEGGADRIELCTALDCGGLTPSPGLIEYAAQKQVPVNVLIRPRAGGFVYDAGEIETMCRDIAFCRQAGIAGVVIGALDPGMNLDIAALKRLIAAAEGLDVTLHRAFDLTSDPLAAIAAAISLGLPRILTSGQAESAEQGSTLIAEMVKRAAGQISIMPGGGINAGNAAIFLAIPGIDALHASCSRPVQAEVLRLQGFETAHPRQVDLDRVKALKAAMDTAR